MPAHFLRQSFSLPSPMLEELKEEARRLDMTLSALVRAYIRHGRLGDAQGVLDLRRDGGSHGDR